MSICIWYEKLPSMHDWVVGNYKLQLFGSMMLSDPEVYKWGVIYQMVKYRVPSPPKSAEVC